MHFSNNVSVTALRTVPMFQDLSPEQLESLRQVAMLKQVPRGTSVTLAGSRAEYVYFILNGVFKVVVTDEEGREVILTMIRQGDVIGTMSMVTGQPETATVNATMPADLMAISCADFRTILRNDSDISLEIMRVFCERLRAAMRKIESLALKDVNGRVARLLVDMAENDHEETIVRTRISKQDIAKMIGASREMVSRVMKDFQTRGLIEETERGVVLHETIHLDGLAATGGGEADICRREHSPALAGGPSRNIPPRRHARDETETRPMPRLM